MITLWCLWWCPWVLVNPRDVGPVERAWRDRRGAQVIRPDHPWPAPPALPQHPYRRGAP